MEVTRLERPIRSRVDVLDIIEHERKLQGYASNSLSLTVGYSINHLTKAVHSGAISVQSMVDYMDTLGMEVIVRRRAE